LSHLIPNALKNGRRCTKSVYKGLMAAFLYFALSQDSGAEETGDGSREKAANMLGISMATLYRKIEAKKAAAKV